MANCETEGHIWDGRPGRDFSCEKCGAPYSVRGPVDAKGGDEGYIAVVPDHCDTIAWRGAYHSLPIPTDPAGVSEMADWWKPNPGDPFWMLEAPDGEWLANEHSLLGTRDAATAIRFPSESHARNHKARMKAGTKWWDAKPTEHKWIERALHASPSTDELVEALAERLREGVKEIGLHEDNNTELFDIDGANEVMWEAANALATLSPSHDSRLADERRFWLSLREPGRVPERKGPWPLAQSAKVLREFIAARPTAYIDYITLDCCGDPQIEHGPEVLQMLDGRSMGTGRKHNQRVREAEATLRSREAGDNAS